MITKKERAILHLLANKNHLSKIKLVKLMFLISKESGSFYNFVPYNYGPFSFELYNDLSRLEREEYISMDENSVKLLKDDFPTLDNDLESVVNSCAQKFADYDNSRILEFIYSHYPQYTIFSQYDKRMSYERDRNGVCTIGYEGKTIDLFFYELIFDKVNTLLDVRSKAFSRKFGFSKGKLTNYLDRLGIEYVHIPELGIPPSQRKELKTSSDYEKVFSKYKRELSNKEEYLKRIREMSKEKRVALMCFEKNPNYCHRNLIAEKLQQDGVGVENI